MPEDDDGNANLSSGQVTAQANAEENAYLQEDNGSSGIKTLHVRPNPAIQCRCSSSALAGRIWAE